MLLNVKNDSLVAKFSKSWKSFLVIPLIKVAGVWNCWHLHKETFSNPRKFETLSCCNYATYFEDFSILTKESNNFKLKIMEILLIACDKLALNKADSFLPLELFWYNISDCLITFYYIIWCPSIPLCICNCSLFSFQYYVTSFAFYQKQNI